MSPDRVFRRRKMGAGIITVIHDALWVEAPDTEADQVKYLIHRMMTSGANLKVPLIVDFK